jgi:hypothetical protein
MFNLQSVLYNFSSPFIDATYSKVSIPVLCLEAGINGSVSQMDKVDPLFYVHSSRIDLSEETRIKATSEEASQWAEANRNPQGRRSYCVFVWLNSFTPIEQHLHQTSSQTCSTFVSP